MNTPLPVDPFAVQDPFSFFQNPVGASGSLNECVARIEALKVRILGHGGLLEQDKRGIFQELDILRGVFLETVAQQQPVVVPSLGQGESFARYGANSLVLEGIIGHNPKIVALLDVIAKISPSTLTVLLEGETGTGKELLARVVHLNSGRKKFVAVNCGAFPPGIIESELFGHVKGAFTNANTDRKGKFEEAHGGTIFLDEIGDMDPTAQVKLLRVLEQGELQRVGSDQTHKIDVRVVAATNKVLDDMVVKGTFREDLLYRLNVCPLTVPPLRERRDEIEILLEYFLQEGPVQPPYKIPRLDTKLRQFLLIDYAFPGNIRELKNLAQYIACIAEGRDISIHDLPDRYRRAFIQIQREKGTTILDGMDAVRHKAERKYLAEILSKNKGSIEGVCVDAGLSKARVYQLIKKFNLRPLDFRP